MSPAAVITGIGLVTPLGATATKTWDALLMGRYIADHAKVPLEFPADLPRVSHLAIRAARQAIQAINPSALSDAAIVVGTSKGPVERWLSRPPALSDVEGPLDFGLSRVASDVAAACEVHGPRLTVSTACASGLHALIRGAFMIRSGEARRVLVVAAEASVHPLFIASFERLGIIADQAIGCRPLDISRQGFLMSEAAAAVWLERRDSDLRGVAVDRFAMAADATHLTRTSSEALPLGGAIADVCDGQRVDLFHAHATGTVQNDEMELTAMERVARVVPSPPPHVYSHKGALGHSLGAAGLVSVVINVLSHRHGVVPPNVRTTDPLPTKHLKLCRESARRRVGRSVAVTAGFGGQIAVVSLVNAPADAPGAGVQ